VVEDVEEIPARLQRKPVVELELPAQRQIELRRAESAQSVASQASVARDQYPECSCADDLATKQSQAKG